MSIYHSRFHIFVTKQFLYGTNIVAVLEQMRRNTMAEGMAAYSFGHAALLRCEPHGMLQTALWHIVAADHTQVQILFQHITVKEQERAYSCALGPSEH